jgi:hypothetical protein
MNNPYNNRNFQNNNLISGFQNFQQTNIPFRNNNLLFNNPQYQNAVNTNMNNMQRMQMMDMYQHMTRLKKAQELKKMEKINDIDRVFDKALIHESVIKPMKEIKEDPSVLAKKFKEIQTKFIPELEENWKKRTNQPYKNVIKDEDYKKMNMTKKTIFNTEKDLIVHTVTDADKIGVMKELEELQRLIEKHDGELKILYSLSNEAKNKKEFEYNHKSKFRVKFDPKDFTDLKKDKIEFIKKEQQRLEKDKKRMEDIIESLLSKGLLTEQEKKALEQEEKLTNDASNLDDIEKDLRKELGDEYYKLEKEALDELNQVETRQSTKELKQPTKETKQIKQDISKKITIKSRPLNDVDKQVKLIDKQIEAIDKKIGTIDENLKDKYKNRQKK